MFYDEQFLQLVSTRVRLDVQLIAVCARNLTHIIMALKEVFQVYDEMTESGQ